MLERLYKESAAKDDRPTDDLKRRAEESRKYASTIRDIILSRTI